MDWNAEDYDSKHDFVFKYGEALLDYLPSQPNKILDVGCGTGELTAQISAKNYDVTGVDQSKNMIDKAKANFPNINFIQGDILKLAFEPETFDTIFSNAVFHWITNQEELIEKIHTVLKQDGFLVCEFGAKGNIATISAAFDAELQQLDKQYQSPFYFPSVSEYVTLLKKHQFKIIEAYDYSRPTPLKNGHSGLRNWVKQFFAADLEEIDNPEQILNHLESTLKDKLWKKDYWQADYQRIRVVAQKI